jgi:hypothetical protein
MLKLVYAATPNPTENVARDYYFQHEKEKVMEFVKDDPELTKYIQRYVDMKEVYKFVLSGEYLVLADYILERKKFDEWSKV